ncbi:MAG: alpha/beta hydrolase [Acidimicrobiales bacterium]
MFRYARNYHLAPAYEPAERLVLTSAYGTALSAARLAGPPGAQATVVVAHGFAAWSRSPRIFAFARDLARHFHVVVFDMRGHGHSSGLCSMGVNEHLDVEAAVRAARPDLAVITVGISLGGAAVLLHAGRVGGVAGVVAVSPPAWWGQFDREGSSRIGRWVGSAFGRKVLRVFLRTRVAGQCRDVPDSADAVASIAPAHLVVVHDPGDHYFGPEHAARLYDWAGAPKALWWYPGAGHGTDLLDRAFTDRLAGEIVGWLARAG